MENAIRYNLPDGTQVEARRATSADTDAVLRHYQRLAASRAPWFPLREEDPERVKRWLTFGGFFDFEKNVHWIATVDGEIEADVYAQRQDNPWVGLQGIAKINLTIGPRYQKAGLGSFMMIELWHSAVVEDLRRHGIRRIFCYIFAENTPALKIATRTGFTQEGLMRQHLLGPDGRYHDVYVYGSLLIDQNASE